MKKIENKKISELVPYTNNPRYNETAIEKVVQSINSFGFQVPILIDTNNGIIAGHSRLEAAKRLNMKQVPCILVDDLTENQIKAFCIADNRVSQEADWDMEALKKEMESLKNDYSLDELGFDSSELENLFFDMEVIDNPYSAEDDSVKIDNIKNVAYKTIKVHFESEEAMKNFSELIDCEINKRTTDIYYPKRSEENE